MFSASSSLGSQNFSLLVFLEGPTFYSVTFKIPLEASCPLLTPPAPIHLWETLTTVQNVSSLLLSPPPLPSLEESGHFRYAVSLFWEAGSETPS